MIVFLCIWITDYTPGAQGWTPLSGQTTISSIEHRGFRTTSLLAPEDVWWDSVGSGLPGEVRDFAVYNGDLVAAGLFKTNMHGDTVNNIARWNGSDWVALGSGTNGRIFAIAVHGGELFAGGEFISAGGVSAMYIARWNGSSWDSVGIGMNGPVYSLHSAGPDLYAGGGFLKAGGTNVFRIARWNGSAWLPMSLGVNSSVLDITNVGSHIYAVGSFTLASGISANRIAKWDGTTWSALGSGLNANARTIITVGNDIYVGGLFTNAGGVDVNRVARWNGLNWSTLGVGIFNEVRDLASIGDEVFAGGIFTTAGGVPANYMTQWNGTRWIPVGSGMDDTVHTLAIDSDGSLIAGGVFATAGGKPVSHIARWSAPIFSSESRILDLGTIYGIFPKTEYVTVRNPGINTLNITSAVSSDAAFSILPASANLVPGDSVVFTLTFTPGDTGFYSGELRFSHNGNRSGDTISVSATITLQFDQVVNDKWNIISVPLDVPDYSADALYPSATSSPYRFNDAYVVSDTLRNGVGYWLKFPSAQTIPLTGTLRLADTVDVAAGWNMIGSLGIPLPVSALTTIPGGLISSNFFGYENSYYIADTIEPGKGYWLKVSTAGKLVLNPGTVMLPGNRLRIELLGETPPAPPGSLRENSAPDDRYRLEQNYPNPFNPVTAIGYSVAERGHVSVTVFNSLGQRVATLVDETQEAGYRTVRFSGENLPSGVYTYRIRSGVFSETKKMLLLK